MTQRYTGDSYRPDVDGLRAVAVLSVILFHLDKALLPGGFVGVDIFFVISGFLISRNILQELERGHFSILDFYRRRAKRIAPAMLVVVAATLAVSQHLMIPEDAEKTAESALWAVLSLANVYFWLNEDSGYFAADSRESPLLHLWSLGVEEQFYIIWPLLLMLAFRPRRAGQFAIVATVTAVLTFGLGEVLFSRDPAFVYYMLPTRAGELLLGVLVAIAVLRNIERVLPAAAVVPLAITGAALVLGSLWWTAEDEVFPGWRAVPPTLGTALLILSGHCRSNAISRLLAVKPMVWVGLVSYSAYLWHWPLLAFYRYGHRDLGFGPAVAVFVLTFLLAWLTYRYVEQPARAARGPALRTIVVQYVLPAGLLAIVALGSMYIDGFGLRGLSASYRADLAAVRAQKRPALHFDYVCQRQRISPEDLLSTNCIVGPESGRPPSAILWGDSNAAHYVGMLGAFAKVGNFSFRNVEIGSCPPLAGDPGPFVTATREIDCRKSLELIRPVVEQYPVVIISSAWSSYQGRDESFLDQFEQTAVALADSGKLVILIGKVPVIAGYDGRCREKELSYPRLKCPEATSELSEEVKLINAVVRGIADRHRNIEYFEVTPYLCRGQQCSEYGRLGRPMYYDSSHLTHTASWGLGEQILRESGLPPPFEQIRSRPQEQLAGAGP